MKKFIARHWPTIVGVVGISAAVGIVIFYENKTCLEITANDIRLMNDEKNSILFCTEFGDFYVMTLDGLSEIIKVHDEKP